MDLPVLGAALAHHNEHHGSRVEHVAPGSGRPDSLTGAIHRRHPVLGAGSGSRRRGERSTPTRDSCRVRTSSPQSVAGPSIPRISPGEGGSERMLAGAKRAPRTGGMGHPSCCRSATFLWSGSAFWPYHRDGQADLACVVHNVGCAPQTSRRLAVPNRKERIGSLGDDQSPGEERLIRW